MRQHWQTAAGRAVFRYPFTIACCLFGLALLVAFRPVVLATAGAAPEPHAAAPVSPVVAVPAAATGWPQMLWQSASIAAVPVFGVPSASPAQARAPRVMVAQVAPADHRAPGAQSGPSPTAGVLAEWSHMLRLVDAAGARPSQASHDLAR
ncbi:MAG: hypothetical protein AAGF49_16820 [Pseudomonadota bacterium]